MIDVDVRLSVADATRRFDLAVRFASDAPVLALFGPSGAGKSLTLQAIAGLIRPQSGHVRIGGRTLFDAKRSINIAADQRGVGFLFQDYALFPHLSVRQNVAFGLTSWWRRRLSEEDAQRVQELMATFELEGLADAKPVALSGGQRQRVALARAMACGPDVLLLDEPFAALNPMLRESLRHELAQVRERWRIPIIMITHDIEDVMALADVACVIEHGAVIREVNVHSGEHTEIAREQLGVAPRSPESERARKVRHWLAQPGTQP
jgi:molybdate transport system ATP-binding protein